MTDLVDPRNLQLIVTNVGLALACVILLAVVVAGVVAELLARRGKSPPDDAAPPTRQTTRAQRTLAEQRDELPDGWPPLPEGRPTEHSMARH